MSHEFEPYNKEVKKSEFSVWQYQTTKEEEPEPEINLEEELLKERERLRQEAREQGYAEGLLQGQAEINAQKTELMKWIGLMLKPVQLIDEELTQEMIQTIVGLCQHCIGVELSVHPDKLCSLINEIKGELPSLQGNKVFAMHPADMDWIKTQFDEKEVPGLHQALVADPSLSRGDFYLKAENTELDGRMQTRFATLFAKYINKDVLITPQQPGK
ncbi:flagellar assembly protein FliH [Legionella fallonii]|uniref:Flagellar assembly protein FliH n=1 Tax=Legionella fallonii LLAP-10 TaxID=1212491 RepID=A0A098G4V7_9GAMM|nr:flagellar assembly protein FliH [Legionella fallonii]CEG56525.1 Polar flagellar assembly protein FliH [Legionella fallonii LLAP-10]